jgi:hypothetical protein
LSNSEQGEKNNLQQGNHARLAAQLFHRATFKVSKETRSAAYLSLYIAFREPGPTAPAQPIVATPLFDLYIILLGVEGAFFYITTFSLGVGSVYSQTSSAPLREKLFDTFESGVGEMRGAENAGTFPL